MQSMTGYGSAKAKCGKIELEVHVKSVNGRFLELRFHLPKEFVNIENDLKDKLKEFKRGSVDVYVHRKKSRPKTEQKPELNIDQIAHWVKTLRAVQKKFSLESEIQIRDILQMPQVMESMDTGDFEPGEIKALEKALGEAAGECLKFRRREGLSLQKELLSQLSDLNLHLEKMRGWRAQAMAQIEARLAQRLGQLENADLDPARLAVESALLVEKMDVQEELVRLAEHISSCQKLVKKSEASGKKLDFYCQELLREVNTIGSKSQLASLTAVVVDAKSTIEKFREQIQNVE